MRSTIDEMIIENEFQKEVILKDLRKDRILEILNDSEFNNGLEERQRVNVMYKILSNQCIDDEIINLVYKKIPKRFKSGLESMISANMHINRDRFIELLKSEGYLIKDNLLSFWGNNSFYCHDDIEGFGWIRVIPNNDDMILHKQCLRYVADLEKVRSIFYNGTGYVIDIFSREENNYKPEWRKLI